MANGGHVIINRRDFVKLGLAIGGATVGYKLFQKDVDRILYNLFYGEPQPRTPPPVVNETAVPTATPSYDYYDEDFKVGINIEGLDKQNVKRLLQDFKEVTPDDYADLIKYAPKKIVRSPDSFSWYAYNSTSDEIQLPESLVRLGGNDNLEIRKRALPNLDTELVNAKQTKNNVIFNTDYDGFMDDVKTKYNYGVKIGVWTREYADKSIESYSETIKNGRFLDGAKLN